MSDYKIVNGELCHADDELKHYGVIGMKWGVRRGKTAQAYAKASKKLQKLDNKVEKAKKKNRKWMQKAEDRQYGFTLPVLRASARNKARKTSYKVAKATRKAHKFYEKMDKVFKKSEMKSLSQEHIAMGKRYADYLNARAADASIIYARRR